MQNQQFTWSYKPLCALQWITVLNQHLLLAYLYMFKGSSTVVSCVYTQQLCRPSTTCYNSLLSPVCGLWLFVLLLVLQPAAERTTVVTFNKLKWTSVLNKMKNVHFVFPLHEEVIFPFRPTCEPISIWLVHSIIPVALCAVSFWDTSTSE